MFDHLERDVLPHAARVLTKGKQKHLTEAVRLLTHSCVLLCFSVLNIHSDVLNDMKIMIYICTYSDKLSLNIH
jgi:hypothetical protein